MKAEIANLYDLFNGIQFSECAGCSKCCYFPWLLEEEYESPLKNFSENVKKINSTDFIMDFTACKYAKCDRCHLYEERPLDCRLFPLDIIEEEGQYWWCIFITCPKHKEIRKKLIPLIPLLNKMITPKMFEQYKKQIEITKEIYLPYKNKQYEKITKFKIA